MSEQRTIEQRLEQIRERLRRDSLLGVVVNAQQLFDDARDLLVMVDDLRAHECPTASDIEEASLRATKEYGW